MYKPPMSHYHSPPGTMFDKRSLATQQLGLEKKTGAIRAFFKKFNKVNFTECKNKRSLIVLLL